MAKPESIMIDEVKYVRADSIPNVEGDIKIIVADRDGDGDGYGS